MIVLPPLDQDLPRLAVGVVGAGVFGRFHAGKIAASPRARLSGVFDPHPERARPLAHAHGASSFSDIDSLIAASDAVIVASPADAHAAAVEATLKAGRHVYVEKPLATTLEDGRRLVALAEAENRVLQVGHQERFVFAAMGLLDPVRPAVRRIECWREGPPSDRGLDVSVTLDLMIHDLDLIRRLIKAPLRGVEAQALAGDPPRADAVDAALTFADGAVAHLRASRVASGRRRGMTLETDAGPIAIDFLARTMTGAGTAGLAADYAERTPDSLGLAVESFLAAARGEGACPVPGAEALAALELALLIDAACYSR